MRCPHYSIRQSVCAVSDILATTWIVLGFFMAGLSAYGAEWAPMVEFDGVRLHKASTNKESGIEIVEYISEGENLESWTQLASVQMYPGINDPEKLVQVWAHCVKGKNPDFMTGVVKLPDGSALLDFVIWPEDASFVEFNVYRISKSGGEGLMALQYAKRVYGDQIKGFLEKLKEERSRIAEAMAKEGLKFHDN